MTAATVDTPADAVPAKAATSPSGVVTPSETVVTMPNNRPTICSADLQNCIAVTSRIHFDGGGYDYHPNTTATVPQGLDDGVNLRRARIGAVGARPNAFNTTRYSEKLLQSSGITVSTLDLSEVFGRAAAIPDGDIRVKQKIEEIGGYAARARAAGRRRWRRSISCARTR